MKHLCSLDICYTLNISLKLPLETDFQEMNLSEKQGYQRVKHKTAQCAENSENEEILRRKMKFFFMNPMEKYLASKQMPWKLGLQILKVLLVTTQLLVFAGNYRIINYWSLILFI